MMSNNAKRLIVINTIRKIIDIFLGPFLTAYFFKISTDSITMISLYNIFSYIVIMFISFIVGIIIKNKYELKIFRLGMITKFIQLVILIILGNKVIDYIWILGIMSGLSMITWSFPLNIFSTTMVANQEKKEFIVYKAISTNIVKVLIPVLFGSLISIESFEKITIIVLVLSFIQIVLSSKLKYENNKEEQKFNFIKEYKKLKLDTRVKALLKTEFFQGLTYEGALDTAVTLLIIIAFQKDFSLGVITSIISVLSIFSAYICKKIVNPKRIQFMLALACIFPVVSTIILLAVTNKYTIVGYSIIYTLFIQIISIVKDVSTLKLTNSEIVNDVNRVETYVLLEIVLGMGRIVSYILLLIIGVLGNFYLLEILIIILTLGICFMGKYLTKMNMYIA